MPASLLKLLEQRQDRVSIEIDNSRVPCDVELDPALWESASLDALKHKLHVSELTKVRMFASLTISN